MPSKDPAYTEGAFTPVMILVDHREKGDILRVLANDPEITVRKEKLEVGDYVLGEDVAVVERKTVADYMDSIKQQRLFAQLDELRRNCIRPVFIVEGHFYASHILTHEVRRSVALYFARYQGVSFIQSKDAADTVEWLKTLARQIVVGAREPSMAKPKDLEGQQLRMLQAIPGVGIANAKALLGHFSSLMRIVNADLEELSAIVKPALAAKVFSFVRSSLRIDSRASQSASMAP